MLTEAFLLLVSTTVLMLRLGGNAGSFPKPLSAQEEAELVERCVNGDLSARNKLIEHNLRLVAHIIKKYYTQTSDQDDLISIGTIGLIKGISSYRPDRGVRLATYASKCIENEILMFFRSQKKSSGTLSLSEAIDADGDGNSLSLMDVLKQDDDMLEQIEDRETQTNLLRFVSDRLTDREAEIIRLRYGIGREKPLTQREVAELCSISRSYVSRRHKCKRCPESLSVQGLVRASVMLG